ncbi:MAG: hypothetical protein JWM82_2509 [Myxococcales bacterium]|nr:hypothetical protein [Myxococcales bacterium]
MVNLKKPDGADPILMAFYEALRELQAAAQIATPASIAATNGVVSTVVMRGVTVTLPGSAAPFTADVYVTGTAT